MYSDHAPPRSPSTCSKTVLVLEDSDFPCNIDEVVEEARLVGAANRRGIEGEVFWIVFANNDPGEFGIVVKRRCVQAC